MVYITMTYMREINEMKLMGFKATFVHIQAKLGQKNLIHT